MTTDNHAPVHAHAAPPLDPPQAPANGAKGGDPGRARRVWRFLIDRGTELLAAVLTLVAAMLGIWGAQLNNENAELAAEVDSLEDRGGVLREDNESLSEDLADVSASRDSWKTRAEEAEDALASAEDSPATTEPEDTGPSGGPGPITAGAVPVFRETGDEPVTISDSYGINLDTRDVNWGVNTSGGDLYFYLSNGDPMLQANGTVALVDQPATHEHCEAQTVLQSQLQKEQVVVGQQFCTKTGEDRWAYVNIAGIDTQGGTITLHIVVYSLDTD
jgi:hypothetical protein